MNELVSVVITTYGRTDTLSRAIASVLCQTYQNIEVIVVDDNAKDEFRGKIDSIANIFNDARLHVIHNAKNLGGALARNEGIIAARGNYIAFLDDDDEYYPEKIEKQYNLLKQRETQKVGLVYCYCEEIKNDRINRYYKKDITGICVYEAMIDCVAATSQWMCSKEALKQVGMFTNTPCKQDSLLMLKLLVNGYSIDRVPDILSKYYVGGKNRISTSGHSKRIIGETKLRAYCRENYHLISKKQVKRVEHAFSCRLVEHYLETKNYRAFLNELKTVLSAPFSRDTLRALRNCLIKD